MGLITQSLANDVENVVPSSVRNPTPLPYFKEGINSNNFTEFEGSVLVSSPQEKAEPLNQRQSVVPNVSSPQIEIPKGLVGLSTADIFIPSQDMLSTNEMNVSINSPMQIQNMELQAI